MWSSASGAISGTVRSWVRDLMNGLYGFLHAIFGDVGTAWNDLQTAFLNVWHAAQRFALSVIAVVAYILRVLIPAVIHDYNRLVSDVTNFAKGVYNYAVAQIERVVRLIASSVDAVYQLVLRDVWRPLLASLTDAWHWITHEGATAWAYISNPVKLVDLIWTFLLAKIEAEAWNIGSLLGKFFLSLIIHNLKRVALLIEDILDAVL